MGTNYYIKTEPCTQCGRGGESIHIGKSSGGWKFVFNLNREHYYKSFAELKAWLTGKQIWNEYDEKITKRAFFDIVATKQHEGTHRHSGSVVMTDPDGYEFIDSDFS